VNCQITSHSQFSIRNAVYARGLERQRGELIDVEEIRALQVRVALRFASVNGGSIDYRFHARVKGIGFIQFQNAGYACELTLNVRNHHVFDLELSHGMDRVDVPGSNGGRRGFV
jgi:hypothetical protein